MSRLFLILLASTIYSIANTYYIDSLNGNDDATGLSAEAAWKTIAKVNKTRLEPGDQVLFRRNCLWRETLVPRSGKPGRPIRYADYGEGTLPIIQRSVAADSPDFWEETTKDIWRTVKTTADKKGLPLPVDIGNIIFNHGIRCGVKKFALDKLDTPYDFYYDSTDSCIYLRHPGNPCSKWTSIELVQRYQGINQGNKHDVTYENLCIRYTGGHAIGGSNTRNITIRNCDIYFIGGALRVMEKGSPHRFGSGIEFWGDCENNLVENNRLWEIFDSALSNQGQGNGTTRTNTQNHIIYRNNLIWNAQFSYTYKNGPNNETTNDIQFINNTCIDAGTGWYQSQRPKARSSHLLFRTNLAKTTNFIVRDNIFYGNSCMGLRMENDWMSGLQMDYNLWFTNSESFISLWRHPETKETIFIERNNLSKFRKTFHQELHGLFAHPMFVSTATRNYVLQPKSPGYHDASDNGDMGRH